MLWYINGEEYVFGNWEEFGTALRDLSKDSGVVSIEVGTICVECNGKGEIAAFVGNPHPIFMECFTCNATGIKH